MSTARSFVSIPSSDEECTAHEASQNGTSQSSYSSLHLHLPEDSADEGSNHEDFEADSPVAKRRRNFPDTFLSPSTSSAGACGGADELPVLNCVRPRTSTPDSQLSKASRISDRRTVTNQVTLFVYFNVILKLSAKQCFDANTCQYI